MITEIEICKYCVCRSFTYAHVLVQSDGECSYQCDALLPNYRQLPEGYYTCKVQLDEKRQIDVIRLLSYEGITNEKTLAALTTKDYIITFLGDEMVMKDGHILLGYSSFDNDCPLSHSLRAYNEVISNCTSRFFTLKITSSSWQINPKGYEIIKAFKTTSAMADNLNSSADSLDNL